MLGLVVKHAATQNKSQRVNCIKRLSTAIECINKVRETESAMRLLHELEPLGDGSGTVVASGTGTASGVTFTDPSAQFVLAGVVAGSLLFLPSGPNFGLYRVSSATSHDLTVDTSAPFVQFPASGSSLYEVIQPESFLSQDQWGAVSQFIRETFPFLVATSAWSTSLNPSGAPARLAAIVARQAQVAAHIVAFQKSLVDGGLYDTRYLWVDQRVNRQDGNLVKEAQADARRVSNLARMLADQKKFLIANSL